MWVGCDWDKNRNEDCTCRLWLVERAIDQSVAGGKNETVLIIENYFFVLQV